MADKKINVIYITKQMHSKFVCKWYSYLLESFWLESYQLNHETIIFSYLKTDGKVSSSDFFSLQEVLKLSNLGDFFFVSAIFHFIFIPVNDRTQRVFEALRVEYFKTQNSLYTCRRFLSIYLNIKMKSIPIIMPMRFRLLNESCKNKKIK